MKKLLFIIVVFYAATAFAQKSNVVVEGITPNLYLTHIVVPKESFYSIGRIYNQAPNTIALFNHTKLDKGLAVGQTLKIPLGSGNFDVTGTSSNDEILIPVYHVVSKNETLFRIGTNHTTPIDNLRKWNNLSTDNIEIGNAIIVGNLKVKKEQLTAFNNIQASNISTTGAPVKNLEANIIAEFSTKKAENPTDEKAVVVNSPSVPVKEVIQTTEKSPVVAKESAPAKQEETLITNEEIKKEVIKDGSQKSTSPAKSDLSLQENITVSSIPAEEGVFGAMFLTDIEDRTLMNKAGEAGTFKSTSGWQDKKYYVLMNDIAPGTIVKLTATTNKVVYAKVLGAMPDTKDSGSLILRMSNAAASFLGIFDPKFPVQVTFYQ